MACIFRGEPDARLVILGEGEERERLDAGGSPLLGVMLIGSALHDSPYGPGPVSIELQGLVRMFLAVLAVEMVSLMGNYT